MNTKTTAIDTYLARTAAIHIKVARLRQLADNHFGHNLDAIHWGHAGDLGRVDQALDDLLAIFDDQAKLGRPRWRHCRNSPQPKPCCCVPPLAALMGA